MQSESCVSRSFTFSIHLSRWNIKGVMKKIKKRNQRHTNKSSLKLRLLSGRHSSNECSNQAKCSQKVVLGGPWRFQSVYVAELSKMWWRKAKKQSKTNSKMQVKIEVIKWVWFFKRMSHACYQSFQVTMMHALLNCAFLIFDVFSKAWCVFFLFSANFFSTLNQNKSSQKVALGGP